MGPERSPTHGPRMGPANLVRGCELNPPAHAFSWQHRPGRPPPASGVPTYQEVSCPRFMRRHMTIAEAGTPCVRTAPWWPVVMSIVAIVPPALSQSDVASKDIHQKAEDLEVPARYGLHVRHRQVSARPMVDAVHAHRPTGALGGQHGLGRRRLRPKPAEYRSAVPKAVGRIQTVRDAVDREC